MKFFYFFLFVITFNLYAQKSLHTYKYVVVPVKFDVFKDSDKYQTSSLINFLLKKKGFNSFLSNQTFPSELAKDRCLALFVELLDDSNFLSTKTSIQFKDCYNNVIYKTAIGKSKQKEFKRAYYQSIRNSFTSLPQANYSHNSVSKLNKVNLSNKSDKTISLKISKADIHLKAIRKGTSYHLIDVKTNTEAYILLKTGVENVFLLKNKKGILFKDKKYWLAELYDGEKKVLRKYVVSFND